MMYLSIDLQRVVKMQLLRDHLVELQDQSSLSRIEGLVTRLKRIFLTSAGDRHEVGR